MDYSEKPKVSGNAIVVTIAVLLFGCIILIAVLLPTFRNVLQQSSGNLPAANTTVTPAPPKDAVAIAISSSNTKEDWMNAVVAQYNSEQHTVSGGRVIFVTVK